MQVDIERDWVGSESCDADVVVLIDQYGGPQCAALAVLRRRFADMVAQPESWDIKDDYGQSMGGNIDYVAGLIRRLETLCPGGSPVDVGSWQSVPIVGPDLGAR